MNDRDHEIYTECLAAAQDKEVYVYRRTEEGRELPKHLLVRFSSNEIKGRLRSRGVRISSKVLSKKLQKLREGGLLRKSTYGGQIWLLSKKGAAPIEMVEVLSK